jgi:DNA-directed RNA polymerase subunit H (RpoH/RPB5)
MHSLQPKQIKLKPEEVNKLLTTLNISLAQLPKIKITDPTLPEDCNISDIIKIERILDDNKSAIYYRVVAV